MNAAKHLLAALAFAAAAACAPQSHAALAVGDAAPGFDAPAWLAGEPFTFHLSEALAKGPVVVYFFPAANTPGCNIEAALFSQAADDFKAKGATLIGVTAGNTDQLREFSNDTKTCGGKFPVAADEGAKIAAEYGAVLDAKPEWSSRTSYVIDRDGRIAAVHSDMSPGKHVKAMMDGLSALGD